MRRRWLVPLVVMLLIVFFRARPAGYTSTFTSGTPNTPTVTNLIEADAPLTPTTRFVTTPRAQGSATAQPTEGLTYAGTAEVAELASPTLMPTLSISTATPTPSIVAATPTHEPPALAPEIAPPTSPPQPTAAPSTAQQAAPTSASTQPRPVRLQIPAIALDLKPVAVGIDRNRVPIVPKHDVGWYDVSALPGSGSNVVFWGHVLRWLDSPQIPAPFARLQELVPGSPIEVTMADGQRYTYRVTQQVQARPEEVQYILPTAGERVTLVSCIGDNVINEGILTKEFRLITIAEPE